MQSNLFSFYPHQIDHIISLKHGVKTELNNLAYACFACNNTKGSDIGTMLLPARIFIRLYNPRIDNWHVHFEMENGFIYDKTDIAKATIKVLSLNEIENGVIYDKTDIAKATIKVLNLNEIERIIERQEL